MKISALFASLCAVALSISSLGAAAQDAGEAADDPVLNRAFQDHIAYVATFAIPVLAEKCETLEPSYLPKFGAAYFRFVNEHQDRIERGRLLTLSELASNDTLQAYRERVLRTRLGAMDDGTPERKRKMCEGALRMLDGEPIPGEWPSRP